MHFIKVENFDENKINELKIYLINLSNDIKNGLNDGFYEKEKEILEEKEKMYESDKIMKILLYEKLREIDLKNSQIISLESLISQKENQVLIIKYEFLKNKIN